MTLINFLNYSGNKLRKTSTHFALAFKVQFQINIFLALRCVLRGPEILLTIGFPINIRPFRNDCS